MAVAYVGNDRLLVSVASEVENASLTTLQTVGNMSSEVLSVGTVFGTDHPGRIDLNKSPASMTQQAPQQNLLSATMPRR